jgi:hypothetical protein
VEIGSVDQLRQIQLPEISRALGDQGLVLSFRESGNREGGEDGKHSNDDHQFDQSESRFGQKPAMIGPHKKYK